MPLPNEHSARLQDPGKFDSFGRTHGGNLYGGNLKVPSTIDVIWGHPKGGPDKAAIPQALRFPISDWSEEAARKWLKDHGVKFISFEPATKRTEGMRAMKIQARVLAMAEAEVLGMISPRTLRDIKREDPSPKLMAFVVGQEGEARPKVVGLGATIQRWFNSAIEALTDRLPLGIPVYHDHPQGTDMGTRQPIGEIVGKALRHVVGTLSAIAVAYIYPAFRTLALDIASIEADIMVPRDAHEFEITDADVKQVTGVALGNSANDTPAFPGATLLAELQAFAEKDPEKGEHNMTLEELRQAVQENKFRPSDVFGSKELVGDLIVQQQIEDMKDSIKSASMRKNVDFEEKIRTLETENKDLKAKKETFERTIVKGRAREAFDQLVVDRPKLKEDVRLLKYVTKAFDRFQPTDEARLKDDLNKFMDDQVKEYQDLFGEPKPGDKGKLKSEPEAGGEVGDDLLNPKNNELIPQ